MTTVYKFKAGYTKLGVATAPSVAPTITVVDSSNNILVNAQATTALANMVGAYLYSYSGADNLDLVAKFTTTDTTMDAQDLFATSDITSFLANLATPASPVASTAAIVSGTTITVLRGDTWALSFADLGSLANISKLYFTIKYQDGDADSAAVVQIEQTGGLLRLNGAAGTSGNGSLTVTDSVGGDITVALAAVESAKLSVRGYQYDVQIVRSSGTPVSTLTSGTIVVSSDVTNAVS